MARKDKHSGSRQRPNAPNFEQVVSQQPPQNPYYPDLASTTSQLLPPPPYSELSVPQTLGHQHTIAMSQANQNGSSVNYSRYQNYPGQQGPQIVIQQVPYDHRNERYNRKVRTFNRQLLTIGVIAAISSIFAHSLYRDRPCLFNFTVHKPQKDLEISINNVKDMHLYVAYISGFVVLLSLLKSAFGFRGKSHPCYLFPVMVGTLLTTVFTGYLAYLAFYSPCALKTNEVASNIFKTITGSLTDSLPAPDKGIFGESNVISVANDDRRGLIIFFIDLLNFAFYFAAFLSSTLMC